MTADSMETHRHIWDEVLCAAAEGRLPSMAPFDATAEL